MGSFCSKKKLNNSAQEGKPQENNKDKDNGNGKSANKEVNIIENRIDEVPAVKPDNTKSNGTGTSASTGIEQKPKTLRSSPPLGSVKSQNALSVSFDETNIRKTKDGPNGQPVRKASPQGLPPKPVSRPPIGGNVSPRKPVVQRRAPSAIPVPTPIATGLKQNGNGSGNGEIRDSITSIGSITSTGFLGKNNRDSVTPFANVTFNFDGLRSVRKSELKDFSFSGYLRTGKIVDIYDGDTCRIAFYMKERFQHSSEVIMIPCRLFGIDTPEIRTKNTDEKIAALKAKKRLCELATSVKDPAKMDENRRLVKVRFGKNDKFGRPLCIIFTELNGDVEFYNVFENSVNHKLVKEGLAKVYLGGTKEAFSFGSTNGTNGTICVK